MEMVSKEGEKLITGLNEKLNVVKEEGEALMRYLDRVGNAEESERFNNLLEVLGSVVTNVVELIHHERRTGEKLIDDEEI
jgi:hypothetical protein